MNVFDMWRGMTLVKIVVILISFVFFSINNTIIWVVCGAALLLATCWMMFRQGQGAGHAACSVSHSVSRVTGDGKAQEITPKLRKQMWSKQSGIRSIFAGAVLHYAVNALYIICMIADASNGWIFGTRLASWVLTIPFWPIIAFWHETFTVLSPDIVIVLMVSPFVFPLCHYAGYLMGPKLWKNTEKAMAEGKRRAKARSRIVKKQKSRVRGPEI